MRPQGQRAAGLATAGKNGATAVRYRAAALGLLAAGAALCLGWWSWLCVQTVHASLGPTGLLWSDLGRHASVEDVLLLVVATAATVACGWLALLLMSGAAALLSPRSQRHASRSPLVSRVSAVLLTLAMGHPVAMAAADSPATLSPMATIVATPMSSPDEGGQDGRVTPPEPGWTLPEPGWTPHAALARPGADGSLLSVGHESSATVVVQRGDTLWDIAARQLGAGASSAEIAEQWPRWWAANAEVIGSDPDLILPGQELRSPVPQAQAPAAGGVDR